MEVSRVASMRALGEDQWARGEELEGKCNKFGAMAGDRGVGRTLYRASCQNSTDGRRSPLCVSYYTFILVFSFGSSLGRGTNLFLSFFHFFIGFSTCTDM